MNSRMKDLLVLISRLEDRRADIRFLLRQDPDVQQEVHTYLDDVSWLSRRPKVTPSSDAVAVGKAGLLSALKQPVATKRHALALPPLVGAIATAGILLSAAMGAQAATTGVPAPITDALNGVGIFLSPVADEPAASELDGSHAPSDLIGFAGFAAQQ